METRTIKLSNKTSISEIKLFLHLHNVCFQMYAEALHENEKLKSRLHDSKHELVKIRSQLEKATQVQKTQTVQL